MKATFLAAFVLASPLVAQTPRLDPKCATLLPAAVVAKAAARAGVTLIPPDPTIGAGGDCNYALDRTTMVLLVTVNRAAGHQDFARYQRDELYRTDQKSIAALGDEAFSTGETIVAARKGKMLIVLSAFPDIDPQTGAVRGSSLTRAQLIDLAHRMLP